MTEPLDLIAAGLLGLLVAVLIFARYANKPTPLPPLGVDERSDQRLMFRLLENLNTLDERYQRVVRRALIGGMILAVTNIVAIALVLSLLDDTRDLAAQQQQGRATAISALCASVSAVVNSGRQTIQAGTVIQSKRFERNLVRLGYPDEEARKSAAMVAARAYGQQIAQAVEDESHVKGVARPDGSLDCEKLKRASGATP